MALGLMCCRLLTARDRASCSSSSPCSGGGTPRARRLIRRHIFFSFPSPNLLISCFRSHPRGTLATGSALGSRKEASVSSHVCWKGAGCARLRGEGAMTTPSNNTDVSMLIPQHVPLGQCDVRVAKQSDFWAVSWAGRNGVAAINKHKAHPPWAS